MAIISTIEANRFRELKIIFDFKELTLFETGYLIADLCHLSITGNLIEDERFEDLDKLYFYHDKYRFPTRYQIGKYCKEYYANIQIKELSKESLDIVISGIGVVSSVVIPIVLYVVNKKNNFVYIYLESNDLRVENFLRELSEGDYGSFTEAFEFMQSVLNTYGHTIQPISDKVFKVLQRSVDRIDFTIQKTYRIRG